MELPFDYKIKGSLRRFVDVMYSATEFKRKVFVLSVKVLLPCSNKWVNESSFMDRRFGLTILKFSRMDCLSFLKFEFIRLIFGSKLLETFFSKNFYPNKFAKKVCISLSVLPKINH